MKSTPAKDEDPLLLSYLTTMERHAQWRANVRATNHPLLNRKDLVQEAMQTCLEVWRRLYPHPEAPPDMNDLVRVGKAAIDRRIRDLHKRSRSKNEGSVKLVSLDDSVGMSRGVESTIRFVDIIPDSEVPSHDLPFLVRGLKERLPLVCWRVLQELVYPSEQTCTQYTERTIQRQNRGDGGSSWRGRFREQVLARSLNLSRTEVIFALKQIKKEVQRLFIEPRVPVRPLLQEEEVEHVTRIANATLTHRRRTMGTDKGFMPDPMEVELPSAGTAPMTPKAPAKKAETKKADNGKATPAKTESKKAAPASKAEAKKPEPKKAATKKAEASKAVVKKAEPAPKTTEKKAEAKVKVPKAEKKSSRPAQPETIYEPGTKVKYLGGARTTKVETGAMGKINARYGTTTVRYGLKFDTDKGSVSTVLAAAYVKAVK